MERYGISENPAIGARMMLLYTGIEPTRKTGFVACFFALYRICYGFERCFAYVL